ncbi:MAG: polyprenyl synthetase family protein [Micrococcales bacterium]|nr:polyprenyl synthetase family protein [Micrococcales bacterium]
MPKTSLPRQLRKVADKDLLAALEAGLERVEEELVAAVAHTDPIAKVTTRHLIDAGGKRIRPTLVLLCAQLGDGAADEVIQSAVVVELTHIGTLYHDDVMDNAPKRRGVDSAHEIWGNNVAILTGDLLFARASQLVSKLGQKALTLQADTFERLCLGQLNETVGPAKGQDVIEHYLSVLSDKTGSLISASAELGVLFSGADQALREPVRKYGEAIGVAFQLIDDVIDIYSDGKTSGKTPGTDLRAGVPTLPVLYLRQDAEHDPASAKLVEIIDGGLDDEAALNQVLEQMRKHPATERAFQEAKRWADQAIAALEDLPEGPVREALKNFADAVIERQN